MCLQTHLKHWVSSKIKRATMKVIKRDGRVEDMMFDKISSNIKSICDAHGLPAVDATMVAQKVCMSLYDGIHTVEIDALSSEIAIALGTKHPDYATLAACMVVRTLHKCTCDDVVDVFRTQCDAGFLSPEIFAFVQEHGDVLNEMIDYTRDYLFDYFGIKTLEKGYLIKVDGKVVERPQHMWLRVALGIWSGNMDRVRESYELMSQKYFTHATPTLFNAGSKSPQLSSCFLLGIKGDGDSLDAIYDTLKDCAQISKWAGGIGLHIHDVRCRNSPIKGTFGVSSGIMPMLRVFNATARYVNQAGRRNGSIAIYLEPSHPDVFEFLEAKKNHGDEEARARDLFYAMWIPDLFMRRIEEGGMWSLFCPNKCPGLADVYGEEYDRLYEKYEKEGKYESQVEAQKLWFAILSSQIETGTPYLLFKDAVNRKSNQMNLGTIKSSNLCTEITEYTSPDEVAVCNLASICLPMFVRDGHMDFALLQTITKVIVKNLDMVIDRNFYPIPQAQRSNMRHRPIGIGVQGLADVFILLKMDFESEQAKILNRHIFETIYYAALESSVELAIEKGPYSTFQGSPASRGELQFDLWGAHPTMKYDWKGLKERVVRHGLRNSLLMAPMPTATTSQIMGNNEAIEPFTSNIYVRRTLAGEFVIINKYLVSDLLELGLWNESMKNTIIAHHGSIQNIPEIPDTLKPIYKTAWEIRQKSIIDMAADRGPFICQSQSLNLFVKEPTFGKLSSMHFYSWKRGLKTGIYYLRTQPASLPVQFTIDPNTCVTCSS